MRDGQWRENEAGLARCGTNPMGPLAHLNPGGPSDTELLTCSRFERGSESGTSEIRERDRVSRGYIMAFAGVFIQPDIWLKL